MSRYSNQTTTLISDQEVALAGVSIYVYDQAGALAALTEDGGGDLTNPVTSDQYGNFHFNTADGLYTLSFHYGGQEILRIERVVVGTGPELPDEIVAALSQTSAATLIGSDDGASGSLWTTVAGFITYLRSPSGTDLLGNVIVPVASRTALKAISTSSHTSALLTEKGREGLFMWNPLVAASRHQGDTDELDLIAPNSGAAGAWVRTEPYGKQDVRSIATSLHGGTNGKLILEKIVNASAIEYAVYEQMGQNSPYFWRWHHSNHTNSNNDQGDARLHNLSIATLFVKTAVDHPAKNNATADQQANVDVVKDHGDATETGTFGTATFDTIAYRTSTTAGDKAVYTITGVERIAVRSYSTSNSGPIKVTVKTGGVEIASDLYTLPAGNVFNPLTLSGSVANSGGHIAVQVAAGLTPGSTYEVTVEVDSSITGGNQIYETGLFGWDANWDVATGLIGLFTGTSNLGGRDVITAFYEGNAWVQQLDDTTRISWKGVGTTESGFVRFTVKNASGTTIFTDTLDLYRASTATIDHEVVSGLSKGTYYFIAEVDGTKNVASTRYRVDHASVEGADEGAIGDIFTQDFDLQGTSRLASSASSTIGPTGMMTGSGTNEVAFGIYKTTETIDDFAWVGGVHGNESDPDTMTFTLDGVAVDFDGGADAERWVANDSIIVQQTGHDYKFGSDGNFSSPAITGNYTRTWAGYGCTWEWNPTIARDLKATGDYVYMFESSLTGRAAAAQPRGQWALTNSGVTTVLPRVPDAFAFYSNTIALVSWPVDFADVLSVFDGLGFNDTESSVPAFLWDPSGYGKFYLRGWTGGPKTVPAGTTWTQKGHIVPIMVRGFGDML